MSSEHNLKDVSFSQWYFESHKISENVLEKYLKCTGKIKLKMSGNPESGYEFIKSLGKVQQF